MSELALIPSLKQCSKCEEEKPLEQFPKRKRGAQGLNSWCRDCVNEYYKDDRAEQPEKYRGANARYRKRNPEKLASRHLLKKYGITLEQKKAMIDSQGGICAICSTAIPIISDACVDHNHITGKIRDILCHNCNVSIGLLKEDKQRIENIRLYLAKHDGNFANVSKFSAYVKEREGFDVLETREGYAAYKISGEECYIKDIFTLAEYRKRGFASSIADRISEMARTRGCKFLTGSVATTVGDPDASLKVLLAYGFHLHSAVSGGIYFRKEL